MVALAPRLVKNLGPFLAASEDTLSLVVETLVTVLSLENGAWLTPDLTAMLSNALLDVWAKNVKGTQLCALPARPDSDSVAMQTQSSFLYLRTHSSRLRRLSTKRH